MPVEIRHIVDYHPVYKFGERNPAFSSSIDSKKLLDFKDSNNTKHTAAVTYFAGKTRTYFGKNGVSLTDFNLAAIVPSSLKGHYSQGLYALLQQVGEGSLQVRSDVLVRSISIQAMHNGGLRDPQVHAQSIIVPHPELVKGARILLMDDVTTTGVTLTACCNILTTFGAADVYCLALGRTC